MPNALDAESRLIIALDVSDAGLAYELCQRIALPRAIYKIGLELLFSGGIELIDRLSAEGRSIFVDAKLLDIGNTVERATARIAALGAKYLTVHAHDRQTLEAAIRGRKGSELRLLGVTLLTSTSPENLREQRWGLPPEDLVLLRAAFAVEAGFDGVVASPREAAVLKGRFGKKLAIVAPGIRPAFAAISGDDQARTSTPGEALRAGADYLVVGRPILQAPDPAAAARAVLQEMADALKS